MEPSIDIPAAPPAPNGTLTPVPAPEPARPVAGLAPQQMTPATCPTCGSGAFYSFVFAVGRIEARFPSPGVEKELAQVIARTPTKGKTDRESMQAVLSLRENRYLARQICWVLTIQGLETYLLAPRDPADIELLVAALRAAPRPTDLDVIIGTRGPIAPPEMCNGLMVPIVTFDQIYSFDRDELIRAIPRPEKGGKGFQPAAEELFDRIMQMTDNAGATDDNRALNYLAVRYPAIYAKVAEQFAAGASLSGVEVRPSGLSAVRRIVDAILAFTNRTTDVTEKFFVRVDVTEAFPFLVTKLSPYYDR